MVVIKLLVIYHHLEVKTIKKRKEIHLLQVIMTTQLKYVKRAPQSKLKEHHLKCKNKINKFLKQKLGKESNNQMI